METSASYQQILLTHEAGHAVAGLALQDKCGDLIVRPTPDGPHNFGASIRGSFPFYLTDLHDPIAEIMILAAGAKAELVCLGIDASAGFAGDLSKIKKHLRDWENRCTESHCHSFYTEELIARELDCLSERKKRLTQITEEIDSNFRRTGDLVTHYRNAIESIADLAIRRLNTVDTNNLAADQVLLLEHDLRSRWNDEGNNR